RELLSLLGVEFEVRPVDVDEAFGGSRPEVEARRIAREKAEAARLLDPEAPIMAADTIVVLDGRILGKPRDAEEAREMLCALRGRTHEVITAVALLPRGERGALARQPLTRVTMRDYADEEVAAAITRGDPFDKAGAYAIQDEVFRPVESYDGCYCNVVGLPLWPLIEMLRKAGVADPAVDRLLPQCAACPLKPPGGVS
ncbi:MAG TPA: Maf family protein, partial [Dehalococcoidia bacterium]|nr:Maf family protein [Dehalococcoidia bacterium]